MENKDLLSSSSSSVLDPGLECTVGSPTPICDDDDRGRSLFGSPNSTEMCCVDPRSAFPTSSSSNIYKQPLRPHLLLFTISENLMSLLHIHPILFLVTYTFLWTQIPNCILNIHIRHHLEQMLDRPIIYPLRPHSLAASTLRLCSRIM